MKKTIMIMLRAVAAFTGATMFSVPALASAEEPIFLDVNHFPDASFREVVQEGADKNDNGILEPEEIDALTFLDAAQKGIYSIKGVEYLKNLEFMYAQHNSITYIDVSQNARLNTIEIYDNPLVGMGIYDSPTGNRLQIAMQSDIKLDLGGKYGINPLRVTGDGFNVGSVVGEGNLDKISKLSNGVIKNGVIFPIDKGDVTYQYETAKFNAKEVVGYATSDNVALVLENRGTRNWIDVTLSFRNAISPKSIERVNVSVREGQKPILPSTVTVYYPDNSVKDVPVRWDNTHDWNVQKSGVVIVDGAIVGTSLKPVAVVTVRKDSYKVKFDTNGGAAVNPVTVEHGKTVAKPADPTRANYTFTGWYTAKFGGEKFDFAKPVTGNVTVFAQWRPRIVFSDVTDKTPHFEDIIWLADNGVSTGWLMPDGKYEFRGMDTVKRQDMAAFLRRLAAKHGIAGAQDFRPTAADWRRFRDVDARTPHAEDILWLASTGISTGWKEADGSFTFRGMDTVKRQDMAAFLYRLADKAGRASGVRPKTDFTDVTSRTPHYKDVEWLGGSGISQGYRNANGTWRFEGMTSVYRQDMAAFLHRLNERLTK